MKDKDKIMQLYKYTDIYGAIKILKTNTILLKSPDQFNDVYDCEFSFSNKAKKETFELTKEYYCLRNFENILNDESIKKQSFLKPFISFDKTVIDLERKGLAWNHRFKSNPAFYALFKNRIKKFSGYPEIEKEFYNYLDDLKLKLDEARRNIYISCFTKRFDSTLMWAHYANQFNGVCVEWDVIRSANNESLVDVKYSKKKPFIDIYKFAEIYFGYDFCSLPFDKDNQLIKDNIKNNIITKSIDWAYEKEIRFVVEKGNYVPGSVEELGGNRALYHMKYIPRRVFLGERVSEEDEALIRDICKQYPKCEVFRTKHSDEKFLIEIDNNPKPITIDLNDERRKQYILLNDMMSIIVDSTRNIADVVFNEYVNHKEHENQKQIYNLFAEGFISLSSFCKLMFDKSWSQAATLLRAAIEEVSSLYVISNISESREVFINLHNEHAKFILMSDSEKDEYLKINKIPRNKKNDYFDYSWIKEFTEDKTYGRDQLLKLANLDEFLIDIKETLNSFAHGSLSIFQFSNVSEKWELMSRYGKRLVLIACKLFDFLCCSFKEYIGDSFDDLRLNQQFIDFKNIYLSTFKQ